MGDWSWAVPLASALLGAGVAGGIAHVNARHFAARQEQRELEREARRESERRLALAHSIVFKVQSATDLIVKVTRHVAGSRVLAAQKGWPLWQAMREFFGTERSQVAFDPNELALFAVSGRAAYTTELQDLASGHNLLVDLLRAYNLLRQEFGAFTTKNGAVSIAGEVASFESADPGAVLLAMRLQQLAESIASVCDGASIHALEMSKSAPAALVEILGDARFKMRIDFPEP